MPIKTIATTGEADRKLMAEPPGPVRHSVTLLPRHRTHRERREANLSLYRVAHVAVPARGCRSVSVLHLRQLVWLLEMGGSAVACDKGGTHAAGSPGPFAEGARLVFPLR